MDGSNIAFLNESYTNIERSPSSEELPTSNVPIVCTHLARLNTDHDKCIVPYRCGEELGPSVLQLSWEADSIW